MKNGKSIVLGYRNRFEAWLAERQWRCANPLMGRESVSFEIENALRTAAPFAIGKVGANEQVLLRWAMRVPIRAGLYRRQLHYRNTRFSLTHAGLRPRSEKSYRDFAALLANSVAATDLLGVWKSLGETELYRRLGFCARKCYFFDLDPWFARRPWSSALAGKRVFVVSPFLRIFKQQLAQRERIWPNIEVLPKFSLSGFEFPYMTDPDCTLIWREVWNSILAEMDSQSFDVVLTGCGALGLPLAAEAKHRGKVGIHLGGMLQLLFGVRGKRYDDSPEYAALMNEFWVQPSEEMRPKEYQTIEGGCYW